MTAKFSVFLAGLFLCSPILKAQANAQEVEHAPAVAQCQADQKLWLKQLGEPTTEANLSFRELYGWFGEMDDCKSIDLANRALYYITGSEAYLNLGTRMAEWLAS